FFGNWMEVGRNPIQGTPGCMIFYGNLTSDNVTLSINGSRSANPTSVYGTIHESAKVKLVANATTGYNVTFNNGAPVMTKLLQFVNYTYLIGCGYTDNQDMSTSFGFILARSNYTLDNTQIAANNASKLYSNFQNSSTFGTINQKGCKKSSAGQSLPMISGVVALALLLIKA
ncbi:CG5399, partial [Drosophila busckii]